MKATGVMATALEEMIKFIKPGVRAHDAHMVCKNVIAEAGLGAELNHRACILHRHRLRPGLGRGPHNQHERGRIP